MKKLVTVLVIMFLASMSFAQSRVMHLMPTHKSTIAQSHSVFVNPPKYAKSFTKGGKKPMKPLAQDDLTHFAPVDDIITTLFMPSTINLGDRSDTIIGYGVHFSSPYSTRLYLDSVTINFVILGLSQTLSEEDNYLKIKAMVSKDNYVFFANGDDTTYLPLPNHAVPNGFSTQTERRAKDSLVIKNLADYVAEDPENAQFIQVTFPMNHKPITTVANPEFYIELLTAFDINNPDFENQNSIALMGDDHEYGGERDFNIHRMLALPLVVEYDQGEGEPEKWWRDLVVYAGITNNDHPDPGFYSNAAIIAHVTDVVTPPGAVEDFKLEGNALAQNYPNPVTPGAATSVAFSLADAGQASLKVYDVLGNHIATVFDGYRAAGKQEVAFDASNLMTGTYYYTFKSGAFTATKRMTVTQ